MVEMQDIVSECPEVRLGLSNFVRARAQMVGRLLCLPYNFCSDLGSGFENIFKRWNLSPSWTSRPPRCNEGKGTVWPLLSGIVGHVGPGVLLTLD